VATIFPPAATLTAAPTVVTAKVSQAKTIQTIFAAIHAASV
jgi:hypothetical protein